MSIITLEEARGYARDYESTDEEMQSYIDAAEKYIEAGVGKVDPTDPRVKLLCKLIVCEIDEARQVSPAEENSVRKLAQQLKFQLRVDAKPVSSLDTGSEGEENVG